MAALSEKLLWPLIGIVIFAVLAAFYIDDRRRLLEESTTGSTNQQASSNEHGGKSAVKKQASNENAGKSAENKSSTATSSSGSSNKATGATSMDINEYLAQSSNERSAELEANVTHHQGFSGSIDEYLSGNKTKATNTQQAAGASSMSMDEYQAKTNKQPSGQSQQTNSGAYHGGIDEYLAKYGNGVQTPMKKQSADPFDGKEHMGFHGSYEEYAKKYN